jgi:hypothetical protein
LNKNQFDLVIENAQTSVDLKAGAHLVKVHRIPTTSACLVFAFRVNPYVEMECYYSQYLSLDVLRASVRTYSEVPEEALFINVHQTNEIAMTREIETLQRLILLID